MGMRMQKFKAKMQEIKPALKEIMATTLIVSTAMGLKSCVGSGAFDNYQAQTNQKIQNLETGLKSANGRIEQANARLEDVEARVKAIPSMLEGIFRQYGQQLDALGMKIPQLDDLSTRVKYIENALAGIEPRYALPQIKMLMVSAFVERVATQAQKEYDELSQGGTPGPALQTIGIKDAFTLSLFDYLGSPDKTPEPYSLDRQYNIVVVIQNESLTNQDVDLLFRVFKKISKAIYEKYGIITTAKWSHNNKRVRLLIKEGYDNESLVKIIRSGIQEAIGNGLKKASATSPKNGQEVIPAGTQETDSLPPDLPPIQAPDSPLPDSIKEQ